MNGFPLDLSRDFSRSELQEQRKRIFELSRENGIDEYADLLDGLMDVGEWDLWEYACNHTVLFTGYFSSVRGRKSFVSGHQQEERGEDGASQGGE